MNVGVAHSEVNPNTRVMNSRGIWLTYALGVGMLHIVLLSIPFFSVPVVWTLTNVIHNFVSNSPPPLQSWCLDNCCFLNALASHCARNNLLNKEARSLTWQLTKLNCCPHIGKVFCIIAIRKAIKREPQYPAILVQQLIVYCIFCLPLTASPAGICRLFTEPCYLIECSVLIQMTWCSQCQVL